MAKTLNPDQIAMLDKEVQKLDKSLNDKDKENQKSEYDPNKIMLNKGIRVVMLVKVVLLNDSLTDN